MNLMFDWQIDDTVKFEPLQKQLNAQYKDAKEGTKENSEIKEFFTNGSLPTEENMQVVCKMDGTCDKNLAVI